MPEPLRSEAIKEIERVLSWLRADEPLPMAGCVLGKTALKLMGKRPRG